MPLLNVGLFGCFAKGVERYSLRILSIGTGIDEIRSTGLGYQHAIFLSKRGDAILSFGNPEAFRLGFEMTHSTTPSRTTPYEVILPSDMSGLPWTHVACGHDYTLIYRPGHSKFISFGRNTFGQLGRGHISNAEPAAVVSLPPSMNADARGGIRKLAAGGSHVVCLLQDGSVWAWGCDTKAQVGSAAHDDDPDTAKAATKASKFGASALTPVRLGLGGAPCSPVDTTDINASLDDAPGTSDLSPEMRSINVQEAAAANAARYGHKYSTLSGITDPGGVVSISAHRAPRTPTPTRPDNRYAQSADRDGPLSSAAAHASGFLDGAAPTTSTSRPLAASGGEDAAPFEWAVDIAAGPSSTAIVTSRGRVLVMGDDVSPIPAPLYGFGNPHCAYPFVPPDSSEAIIVPPDVVPPTQTAVRRAGETPAAFRARLLDVGTRHTVGRDALVTAGLKAFSGAVAVGDRGGFCVSHAMLRADDTAMQSTTELLASLKDPRDLSQAIKGRVYVWGADGMGGAIGTPGGIGTQAHRNHNSVDAMARDAVGCVVSPEVLTHVAMGGTRGYFASEAYFYAVAPHGGMTPVAAVPVSSIAAGYDAAAVVLDTSVFDLKSWQRFNDEPQSDANGMSATGEGLFQDVGDTLPVSPRDKRPHSAENVANTKSNPRLGPEILKMGVASTVV